MKIKVYSQLPFSITSEMDAVVAFFKPYISLTYEIIPCNIPVQITPYKTVQGFNPMTGKPSLIKYYGLIDCIRTNFRDDCDLVIFAWDINVLPAPTDGSITSWTSNVPLSIKTDFIQLAVNQYVKNINGITNRITHEICHALCFKANRAGVPTLDEMDMDSKGRAFYLNDTPLAPDGNYSRTLSNLKPYLQGSTSPVVDNSLDKWGLVPSLKTKALIFLENAKLQGYNLKITQGWRDPAYQDKLYSYGRTDKSRPIVTNATGKTSKHCSGMAIDVAVIGKIPYPKNYQWDKVGVIGENCGLKWGGRWKSFKDVLHFELK